MSHALKKSTVFLAQCALLASFSFACVQRQNNSQQKTDSQSNSSNGVRVNKGLTTSAKIQFGGFLGIAKGSALVFAPRDLSSAKKTLVFSPGAQISSEKMSGLANQLAEAGVVTYMVDYLEDLAIFQPGLAVGLAETLVKDPSKVENLSKELVLWHKSNKNISLAGHSQGGAVLGKLAGKSSAKFLQSILLIGVSSIIGKPEAQPDGSISSKVVLITGEKDGVISADESKAMEDLFQTQTVRVAGVNHFCIADDKSAGNEKYKAKDNPTDLSFAQCQLEMAKAIVEQL